jgi:hypothetical protein
MNSDRGKLLCQESTDPARNDQPALSVSSVDALMELVVAPRILERAWRQVKRNRERAPTGGWSSNVLDRLIQQAISQVLTPTFDRPQSLCARLDRLLWFGSQSGRDRKLGGDVTH